MRIRFSGGRVVLGVANDLLSGDMLINNRCKWSLNALDGLS